MKEGKLKGGKHNDERKKDTGRKIREKKRRK